MLTSYPGLPAVRWFAGQNFFETDAPRTTDTVQVSTYAINERTKGEVHPVAKYTSKSVEPASRLESVDCPYFTATVVAGDGACMYGHTYSTSMDRPGKVTNPVRDQLNYGIPIVYLLPVPGVG